CRSVFFGGRFVAAFLDQLVLHHRRTRLVVIVREREGAATARHRTEPGLILEHLRERHECADDRGNARRRGTACGFNSAERRLRSRRTLAWVWQRPRAERARTAVDGRAPTARLAAQRSPYLPRTQRRS